MRIEDGKSFLLYPYETVGYALIFSIGHRLNEKNSWNGAFAFRFFVSVFVCMSVSYIGPAHRTDCTPFYIGNYFFFLFEESYGN